MIQAILANKAQEVKYKEDILTSIVFGTLKYLRPDIILIPFIESAFLYNEKRTSLWESLSSGGIELRCYREIEYIFWPKHNKYGEPDLIIVFKNHIHGADDFLLVVEAKFKSEKSGTEENDQLVRYFEAINNNIEGFSENAVSDFKGKKGQIIYLTEAEAYSEISASSKILESKYNIINERVFHLRWHQLFKTIEIMYEFCSSREKLLVNDLMEYLEALGLKEFAGISPPNIFLNEQRPVFYQDKLFENEKITYFDHSIPDFDLDDQAIFYRGN